MVVAIGRGFVLHVDIVDGIWNSTGRQRYELTSMGFFFQLQRSSYPLLQTYVDGMQVDGRSGRGEWSQRERTLVMGAVTRTDVA